MSPRRYRNRDKHLQESQIRRQEHFEDQQERRLSHHILRELRRAQQHEITEHLVYSRLAAMVKNQDNREILEKIAEEEKRHAGIWQQYSQEKMKANQFKAWWYVFITKILGLSFGTKLLERNEEQAQINYQEIGKEVTEASQIKIEEEERGHKLGGIINEENLKYVGSMVLGVSDALVELTGALAGLTLALQQGRLIAITGLITGIAASFSMAASEYLATKAEAQDKDPIKASLFTGGMYITTVLFLILPYFLIKNIYWALGITLSIAILIVFAFTFYVSIAQDKPFKKRFIEMAGISLAVSGISFVIGFIVNRFLGLEV